MKVLGLEDDEVASCRSDADERVTGHGLGVESVASAMLEVVPPGLTTVYDQGAAGRGHIEVHVESELRHHVRDQVVGCLFAGIVRVDPRKTVDLSYYSSVVSALAGLDSDINWVVGSAANNREHVINYVSAVSKSSTSPRLCG